MRPRVPLLLALLVLLPAAAVGLAGCFGKSVGTWESTPVGAVTEGTPVLNLPDEHVAALPRSVGAAALEAAARGERRMLDLSEGEAAGLRAVIPANPAVVRFEGGLMGIAQVSVRD